MNKYEAIVKSIEVISDSLKYLDNGAVLNLTFTLDKLAKGLISIDNLNSADDKENEETAA